MRHVHETTVAVEKRYVLYIGLCVRACGYTGVWACACAYVHIALLIQHATRMRHILTSFVDPRSPSYFSTLSHKRCDFRKKVIEHKICVFIFSTTFVWNMSHFKKNLARYRQKFRNVFKLNTHYFCRIEIEFEFYRQIFEKASNIMTDQDSFSGSRVIPCGRRDGHEDSSRFSQFREGIPSLVWTGSLGSSRLRLPEFLDNWHMEEVGLSTLHDGPPSPGDISGTHFCYRLSRLRATVLSEGLSKLK
jgi:hypothetical protein